MTGALKSILRDSSLLTTRYDFAFILPKKSVASHYVKQAGFPVLEFPLKELQRSISSFFLYIPYLLFNTIKLFRLLKHAPTDLIIVNDFYNLIPSCYKFFGGKLPYICFVRFLPSKFPAHLVNFWCSLHRHFASSIIAVSEAVKKELPYTEKVEVIYHGLPAEKIEHTLTGSTLILYPANYIQGKGQEYALESFGAIHMKFPNWKIRFVGGDMGLTKNQNFKNVLMKRAEVLGLQNQVEWLDFSDEIGAHYLQAAIVLNFSESESFSMTCLEAMYYGRPVIATKCGGPVEIIDHYVSGILVELQDIREMAAAMEFLITHLAEREAMAKEAYQSVREKFSYSNTVEKLNLLYQAVLLK